MAILRIFLFNKASYLKERNVWPQKKIFNKGYRNGKVCYFLLFLFSSYSLTSLTHPPLLKKRPFLLTCWLTSPAKSLGITRKGQRHQEVTGMLVIKPYVRSLQRWKALSQGRQKLNEWKTCRDTQWRQVSPAGPENKPIITSSPSFL